MAEISIILPTYNESDNIERVITQLANVLTGMDYELIVVDDGSTDGTAEIAEGLSRSFPVRTVNGTRKGLASAILTGFENATGEVLGVLDADGQHPPDYVLGFLDWISQGTDIVLGSRYIDGGNIDGWSLKRKLMSRVAILLARPLLSGEVKDPISGYFFVRREVIENMSLNPTGYKLSLEILAKGRSYKVQEIPFAFKLRIEGESKIGIKEILKYLQLLTRLYLENLAGFLRKEAKSGTS